MSIKVTLEFADTAALLAYFNAPKAAAPGDAFPPIVVEGKLAPTEPVKEKAAPKLPKTEKPAPTATASAEQPAASAPPVSAPPGVEYAALQKAVFKLAGLLQKKGRSTDDMLGIARGLGGKTFKDLTADKWADALAQVEAMTAEVEAAEEVVA